MPPRDLRETRARSPIGSAAAAFGPSEYTRARVTCSRRWCDIHHPAWATAVTVPRCLPRTSLRASRGVLSTTLAL